MEAPKPIDMETPKEIDEFNIELSSNENNFFKITLRYYNFYLLIVAFKRDDFNQTEFERKYFLNDLKKYKYFAGFDKIDDIFEQLKFKEFKKDNIKIIESNNLVKINIPIDFIKEKELIFDLPIKVKKDNEKIEILFNEVNRLKLQVNDMKITYENQIKNLKDENKYLKDELKNLKEIFDKYIPFLNIFIQNFDNGIIKNKEFKDNIKKEILQEEVIKYKNEEDNENLKNEIKENKINEGSEKNNDNRDNYLSNNSFIIKNDIEKQNLIINWIKQKIKNNFINFELIFRMSENGKNSDIFHKLCDLIGPTLTLIKTTKNRVFGGFTPLNWDDKSSNKNDETNQTFIFSLNLMKKYDIIDKDKKSIICKTAGPIFGDWDFGLENELTNGITYANRCSNFLKENDLELTGDEGEYGCFETQECEVFKVIY